MVDFFIRGISGAQSILDFLLSNKRKVFLWFGDIFDKALVIIRNVAVKISQSFSSAVAFMLRQADYVLRKAIVFSRGLFNRALNLSLSLFRLAANSLSWAIEELWIRARNYVISSALALYKFAKSAAISSFDTLSKLIGNLRGRVNLNITALSVLKRGLFPHLVWIERAASLLNIRALKRFSWFEGTWLDKTIDFTDDPFPRIAAWLGENLYGLIENVIADEISNDKPVVVKFRSTGVKDF